MSEEGIEIAEDFQGWPIYKRTWKWILERLGVLKEGDCGDSEIEYTKLWIPTNILEQYPSVLEDDGMGYSPGVRFVTDIEPFDGHYRIWIDMEDPNYNKEDDSYSIVPWPEVQDYMKEEWFKEEASYDPMKNLWFIPNKYIK